MTRQVGSHIRVTTERDGQHHETIPNHMSSSPLTQDDIRRRLVAVLPRHDVLRAILFGSLARGEGTRHSDIDLLLVRHTAQRFLDRTQGIQEDLALAFPEHAVEALVYTPEELEALHDRPFIRTILAEGRLVYEREQATA